MIENPRLLTPGQVKAAYGYTPFTSRFELRRQIKDLKAQLAARPEITKEEAFTLKQALIHCGICLGKMSVDHTRLLEKLKPIAEKGE